ncbi:DUF2914 domain-containing protein [Thermodesulfobacteriota bacterium]
MQKYFLRAVSAAGSISIFKKKLNNDQWRTTDRIPMPIVGGREEGFRGYAYKRNYSQGNWRAMIETEERLEIGRIYFSVTLTDGSTERTMHQETH